MITIPLLSEATSTVTGSSAFPYSESKTFHASGVTSAGTGAAVIAIEASNDGGLSWVELGSIALSLSTTRSAAAYINDNPWIAVRGRVESISGTGASVSLTMAQ
jgi:hypothetical protein